MGNVTALAEFFLISLSFGVGLFTFLADPEQTGGGFHKVVAALCAVSTMVALSLHLTYAPLTSETTILLALSIVAFSCIYFFHGDKKTKSMRLLYITHNVCLSLCIFNFHQQQWTPFLFGLTSALLLGSITYAMVMGHWYLVTPRLSEVPLKYATYVSWFFLVIKVGWTAVSYWSLQEYFSSGTYLGAGYLFNWLMLTMRVGWGYLVIGVMSYFSYRLISMRSIQSATGMLYAMTFFIFIGELISNYMFLQYKMMI